MKAVKNQEVVRAWSRGEAARNHKGSLVAMDTGELYSYGLKIGQYLKGNAVLSDYTAPGGGFYSMTTSQHVNLAKVHASRENVLVMHPLVWEASALSDELPF